MLQMEHNNSCVYIDRNVGNVVKLKTKCMLNSNATIVMGTLMVVNTHMTFLDTCTVAKTTSSRPIKTVHTQEILHVRSLRKQHNRKVWQCAT